MNEIERQPVLDDGVVRLDSFTEADIPAIVAGDNDPEHAFRFGWRPGDSTEANARRYVEDSAKRWTNRERVAFAVRDRQTSDLLGGVELNFQSGDGRAKISYWTYARARRQGIASRAVKLACRFGFEQLDLRRIQLLCEEDNIASLKVARNAGFVCEGLLRAYGTRNETAYNMVLHSLLPSDSIRGKCDVALTTT